jgi:hypothetical protein
MAIAGGASVSFPQAGYFHDESLMFSADGHSRAFDSRAAGAFPATSRTGGAEVPWPMRCAMAIRSWQ